MSATQWRTDVQGLRAVAVGLVVAAHAGIPYTEGGFVGVDVFFVLSGFLITTLLLREAKKTGTVSIPQFYARRARRILPAATLVILVVLAYAAWQLPTTRLTDAASDGTWAAFFLANVHFAAEGVQYFQPSEPSPFQHYWSLSVEEQFYLVWPVLALLLVPRLGRKGFAVVAAVIALASLAWSVHAAGENPTSAYFSTPARAYELAAGALLACWGGRLKGAASVVAGLGGASAILGATVVFSDATPFPGWQALVPTLGTVALLASGAGAPTAKLLAIRPLRYVGDISYSLYLWHWPLIILAPELLEIGSARVEMAVAVLAAMVLSALSHRFVEVPFQTKQVPVLSHGLRSLVLWPVAVVLAVGSGWLTTGYAAHAEKVRAAEAEAWFAANPVPDTAAETGGPPQVQRELRAAIDIADRGGPIPAEVIGKDIGQDRWQKSYPDCWANYGDTRVSDCELGEKDAKKTVAVVGDSHAGMWLSAFDDLGRERGFRVVPVVKVGCAPYPVQHRGKKMTQAECDEFRDWSADRLERLDPDVIVSTARGQLFMPKTWEGMDRDEQWSEAVRSTAESYREITRRVVVLGDVPPVDQAPADCLSDPDADQGSCLSDPDSRETSSNALTEKALDGTGARYVDTQRFVCVEDRCPLVVGERVTYYDVSHLTESWVRHVAPRLGAILEPLV
ncbi:peptidoglycan/LPS O-acetylase OafA/YrhL [Nocardioides luteus]|uniref:Acyltransferase n=1 Tax=Nocardioides luteus TaxID=1844 RepID=A0ABQ5SSU6_9ACTN|nr:acyltransferase family protein [Nocardioides luteus]MDR7309867.1 peptidoglycan/LPS O-acetylase OafA/YrhL [Nocardioides luteus]GGR59946.1 acyltransferase [Nocardioides luteus]GLJ67225.1 acyltransferase [Nocardioides luteus]